MATRFAKATQSLILFIRFPELGIVHNKPVEAREKFKPFLFELLDGFCKGLKWHNNVTIFPGSQFLPAQINEYEKKDRYIVIFLGINDTTPELLLKKIRETEAEHDWTHKQSDESLLERCKEIIKESVTLENECKKYGFYYFNTFNNREKMLNEILDIVSKEENDQ